MNREEAIQIIEHLYPGDSQFTDTARIGHELLALARKEHGIDWRQEKTEVLLTYANLCILKDQQKAFKKKRY